MTPAERAQVIAALELAIHTSYSDSTNVQFAAALAIMRRERERCGACVTPRVCQRDDRCFYPELGED